MPPRIDRRSSPRPPLWLNLIVLIAAAATFAYARYQRTDIDRRTALLFHRSANNPADLNRFRDELAAMDLTKEEVSKKLDERMSFLQTIQSQQFYISIDVPKQKFYFRFDDDVAREADAHIDAGVATGVYGVEGKDVIDGRHVILLTRHRAIAGAPPAAIVVPDADLAALWPRISTATKVFIF